MARPLHPSALVSRVRLPLAESFLCLDALYSKSHQAPKEVLIPLPRNDAFLKAEIVASPKLPLLGVVFRCPLNAPPLP